MSRSRKDGRRKGGHFDTTYHELWSRRFRSVNGDTPNRYTKTRTHRHERRASKRLARILFDTEAAA